MSTIRSAVATTSSVLGGAAGAATGAALGAAAVGTVGALQSTYGGVAEAIELPKIGKPEVGEIDAARLEKLGLTVDKVRKAIAEGDSTVKLIESLLSCKLAVVESDGKTIVRATGQLHAEVPENATAGQRFLAGVKGFARSGLGKTTLFGLGGAAAAAFLMSPAGWPVLGGIAAQLGLTGIAGGAIMGAGTRVAYNIAKRAAVWTVLAAVVGGLGGFGGAIIGSRLVRVDLKPKLKRIDQLPTDIQHILSQSGALEIGGKTATRINELAPHVADTLRENEVLLTSGHSSLIDRHVYGATLRVKHLPAEAQALLQEAGHRPDAYLATIQGLSERTLYAITSDMRHGTIIFQHDMAQLERELFPFGRPSSAQAQS